MQTKHGTVSPGTCEFDGKLSVVLWRGRLLLYARANPAAYGQRFVQVATSTYRGVENSSTCETRWSPFEMIRISKYSIREGELPGLTQ